MATYKVKVSLSRPQRSEVIYYIEAVSAQEARQDALALADEELGAAWDEISAHPRNTSLAGDDE